MAARIVAKRTYGLVCAALMLLTALTVQLSVVELGPLNTVAALGIAVVQAVLVVLFFMHVNDRSRLPRLAVMGGLYWLLILLGLTLSDYLTRSWGTY